MSVSVRIAIVAILVAGILVGISPDMELLDCRAQLEQANDN